MSDYDRYDWDTSDPRQHCRHGKFIGSWWGPDILCGQCESGDEDPSINDMIQVYYDMIDRKRIENQAIVDFVGNLSKVMPKDLDRSFLGQAYIDHMNGSDSAIKAYKKKIQETIDYFSQFTDDYDDRNVLYLAHSAQIEEYDKFVKDMKEMESVQFD